MQDSLFLKALADSLLAGEPSIEATAIRLNRFFGKNWEWTPHLARRYARAFAFGMRPRRRAVVLFLRQDRGFRRALTKHKHEIVVASWLTEGQRMLPVREAQSWQLPSLESPKDLANSLAISLGDVHWFADLKGLAYKNPEPKLRHYHYRVLPKQFGNLRVIESPKPRLKELQRRILTEILDRIPPHDAAHGFTKGRSVRTFVAGHIGKRVVLRMDLQDFFTSITRPRIQAIFRTLGYPEEVSDLMGGICANQTPADTWKTISRDISPDAVWKARWLYKTPHLPQGAPTSPALANLCAYRADCRLQALAEATGAIYSRYADDLAFSGEKDFERKVDRFALHAAAVLMEEGFNVHHRKTRVMREGVRQHLAGLVINERANVIRTDFDRLKAALMNCVRFGPESQNRDSHPRFRDHLEGRVAYVESIHASRGRKLRQLLQQVMWD